ncbi:MAG: hypothetical protein HKN47_26110 [Pirellulaceae bacterium]|nr:hypothetical protein [Pirellulaceae bacterium]
MPDPPATNPFSTRFVRPGSIPYQFSIDRSVDPTSRNPLWSDDPHTTDPCRRIVHSLLKSGTGTIVGQHGTGKTTLLHTLANELDIHFDAIEWVQLHAATDRSFATRLRQYRQNTKHLWHCHARLRKWPGQSKRQLLIVDGLEQLNGWTRRRMIQTANRWGHTVLATCHHRIPTMATLFQTATQSSVIERLTDELIAQSPADLQNVIRTELLRRDLTTVENVRELWFDLYDLVADFDQAK